METHARVDVGCCTAYWTMQTGHSLVSEISVDRSGHIYETYFVSKRGLEGLTANALLDHVKAAHLNYDHDADIQISACVAEDRLGEIFCALDVCIADKSRLFRKRPPFYQFYQSTDIPLSLRWDAFKRFREAQETQVPFLLIEGQTGSPSWGDSETASMISINSLAQLEARLKAAPCVIPAKDYCTFNLGVLDARNNDQPFNEAAYCLADQWPLTLRRHFDGGYYH
ncbi:hypothetical protein [Hyphomonas sp.]|jgi:hypothetical protein|uniref:hypothetical protein n=1 Tax=Hyphomonas sp. TaxID=87 RepID=UPI0039E24598